MCPICGDREVSFHSDVTFPLGLSNLKSRIFICSECHTFLVPDCSLRAQPQKMPSHKQRSTSIEALEVRADAARERLKSSRQEFDRLKAQLLELQDELRRTHAAMQLTHAQSRVIVAECRENSDAGSRLCVLIEFGLNTPSRTQDGRNIQ